MPTTDMAVSHVFVAETKASSRTKPRELVPKSACWLCTACGLCSLPFRPLPCCAAKSAYKRGYCHVSFQKKPPFRRLLAQIRWAVNHVSPQFAYSLSKTAQKPEDERSATDVQEWNKLVSEVKVSNQVETFRLMCLEEVVVVTIFDSSFAKVITTRGVEKGPTTTVLLHPQSDRKYAGESIGSILKCS